jgi:hypothetical protein
LSFLLQAFFLKRWRKIAKSDYSLRHACPSVCMEQLGSNWKGFSLNFKFEDFSKIGREKSSLANI